MKEISPLKTQLSEHFCRHQSRIDFLAKFIIALLRVETVNLMKVAKAFSGKAQIDSHYKRIKRFLCQFNLDHTAIARLFVCLFPLGQSRVLCLDRTNWKFGQLNINILVLAVAYKGIAIPLFRDFLPKQGNSNTTERKRIIERFLKTFPKERIA